MRKWAVAIAVIGALAVVTGMLLWAGSALMEMTVARGDGHWPFGLGTIDQVPDRYPKKWTSHAATRISELGAPLQAASHAGVRVEIHDYLRRQVEGDDPSIDPASPGVEAFLKNNAGRLRVMRRLMLSGAPLESMQDIQASAAAPMPRLNDLMQLSRTLQASALARARGNDAEAWKDLEAVWRLNRNLLDRPEIISVMIGIANARSVNALARKMPLPLPEWFRELQGHDYRKAMVAAHQAEAWAMVYRIHSEGSDIDPRNPAVTALTRVRDAALAPYDRMCATDEIDRWRRQAHALAVSRSCDVAPDQMEQQRESSIPWWNLPAKELNAPNMGGAWRRVFRFRAEIEATERAIELRGGRPPRPESACAEGSWVYGERSFRFSHEFPPQDAASVAIPLHFSIEPVDP